VEENCLVTPQALKTYLEKSGDSYIHEDNLIENEHGFLSWCLDEDGSLVGLNVYGDGDYWDKFLESLAVELKAKRIRFASRRNPDVWKKKYNYKVVGHIFEKEVNTHG